MTISPEALEAIGAEHEAHEREIASLKRQRDHFIAANAALIEEKNGLELRLSLELTKHKLAEANLLRRVRELEEKVDAMAQVLAGEFKLVQEHVSYLMAHDKV